MRECDYIYIYIEKERGVRGKREREDRLET